MNKLRKEIEDDIKTLRSMRAKMPMTIEQIYEWRENAERIEKELIELQAPQSLMKRLKVLKSML